MNLSQEEWVLFKGLLLNLTPKAGESHTASPVNSSGTPVGFFTAPWVSCLFHHVLGVLGQEVWCARKSWGSQSQTQLSGWATAALVGGSRGSSDQVFVGLHSLQAGLKVEVPERAVLCSLGRSSRFEFPAGWELLCLEWGLWPECVSAFPSSFSVISRYAAWEGSSTQI